MLSPRSRSFSLLFASLIVGAALVGRAALLRFAAQPPAVIGEVAVVTEVSTGVEFTARVDTGAAVSSVHVAPEDMVIEDESPLPVENIDKTVRLRLDNGEGANAWVETKIEDYVEVRNAETSEHRYRVRLPIQVGDVLKHAVVNLNDRSNMSYRFLLGRDFLKDDFLVDVAHSDPRPRQGG